MLCSWKAESGGQKEVSPGRPESMVSHEQALVGSSAAAGEGCIYFWKRRLVYFPPLLAAEAAPVVRAVSESHWEQPAPTQQKGRIVWTSSFCSCGGKKWDNIV